MEPTVSQESKEPVADLGIAKFYRQFKNYTTKKDLKCEDILVAFNNTTKKISPAVVEEIKDYEKDLIPVIDSFVQNVEIELNQQLLLFKSVMCLIKILHKREGKDFPKNICHTFNEWQTRFFDISLPIQKKRNIILELHRSLSPYYSVKIKGKGLEFNIREDSDDDMHPPFISELENSEIDQSVRSLRRLPQEKEDQFVQKLSLAIKRDPSALFSIVSSKHSKIKFSKNTMLQITRSIFESYMPPSSGYGSKLKKAINNLLGMFSRNFDEINSIREVFYFLVNVDDVIPSNLQTPNIRRNFIGFAYTVLENVVRSSPNEFFNEFFVFFRIVMVDMKNQAEESLTENDPIFAENFQRCYLNISEIILLYADDQDKIDKLVSIFVSDYSKEKLTTPCEELRCQCPSCGDSVSKKAVDAQHSISVYQTNVMFNTFSMLARYNNVDDDKLNYFNIDLSSKKCALNICVSGSLENEADSLIIVLKRSITNNSISFGIKGRHQMKFKVDDSVNKSHVRSLLDTKMGANRDEVHKWKVLERHKTAQAVLYCHIALYMLLKDSENKDKLDKNNYICDTLLNFAIVNNVTTARHAIDTLTTAALRSSSFFQNTLFSRLCRKLIEFDESFHEAEREKSSDFVLHPHKSKNIKKLVLRCLHGDYLVSFNRSTFKPQNESLEPKALLQALVSISTPVVYNFVEVGSKKYNTLRKYVDNIKTHYEERKVDFNEIFEKISDTLLSKISTKMFLFSDQSHMRTIAINVSGIMSCVNQHFYDKVSGMFKLDTTIDQVKKCLKCKEMFKEQYPGITFYDMNHISDSAGALMKVFENKINSIKANKPEPEIEEEKDAAAADVKSAPKNQKDLNKLLLGAMGGAKKKGKKGGKPKKDKPKADKPAETKPRPTQVSHDNKPNVEENKDERMKRDLRTVNTFLHYTFMKACTYINSICEIYELASRGKNDELLDKIIYQNIHTFIELLRYPYCNFIIKKKLPSLLANNSGENKILKIKDCLIECLLMSAKLLNETSRRIDDKTLSKNEVDKQFMIFFKIISDGDLDFSKLGRGMIRLILTNVNFAIKHSEISQTYKENAVSIALKILKTSDCYDPTDLLRVAQTLLKQDYTSKCGYKFLSILFKQITDEERIVICSKLFEYHTLQLSEFFKVLFDYDSPLARCDTFEVQLWIMQFEEEPINKIAQSVWNKYYSNVDVIEEDRDKRERILSFSKYALDTFGSVSKKTTDAFVAAINIDKKLLVEYVNGIREIIGDCHSQEQADEQLKFFAAVVNSVANLVDESQFESLYEFIVYEGYLNPDKEISESFKKCGISVCIEQGKDNSIQILKILKGYLLNPINKRADIDNKKEQRVLNVSLVLIASLAKHFDQNHETTLDIYERIIEMLNIPNKELKRSISKCISPLSKLLEDKSKKFLKQLISMLMKTKDLSTLSGAAYAISGVVKGLGITAIDRFEVLDTLEKEANAKNANPLKKVALLN